MRLLLQPLPGLSAAFLLWPQMWMATVHLTFLGLSFSVLSSLSDPKEMGCGAHRVTPSAGLRLKGTGGGGEEFLPESQHVYEGTVYAAFPYTWFSFDLHSSP